MTDQISEMIKEANKIETDAVYSYKGHFEAARLWRYTHYFLSLLATIFAACAGTAFINTNPNLYLSFLAIASAILTGILTFLKPSEKAEKHQEAGVQFAALRRNARIFQNIEACSQTSAEYKIDKLQRLADKVVELNRFSLPIPQQAYKLAKKGIGKGEANYGPY